MTTSAPSVSTAEKSKDAFATPKSLEEARSRQASLSAKFKEMTLQLADKSKSDRFGQTMGRKAYKAWRADAVQRLMAFQGELGFLKKWIKETTRTEFLERAKIDPKDHKALIHFAHELFMALKRDGVEYDEEEWAFITLLEQYKNDNRPGS